MGLELLPQPESPAGLRLSLDKTYEDFSRMADNRTKSHSRIALKRLRGLAVTGVVYAWTHVLGAIATT